MRLGYGDRVAKNITLLMFGLTTLGAGVVSANQVDTEEHDGSSTAMEEVLVTASPIWDSQWAAMKAKRNADNYVDVVSADTIGRFPDQNIADSLGRLPGLAIERDQGQARYINLRGAPFRYTSIAFDGIDVPGAENGRIPRFDSFPSVITSRIEVNKAILPSMPGESVAGYININTFNPFQQQGLSVNLDVGTGTQNLGDGDIDKSAVRASWSGDNIGVTLFGSRNNRNQITDNREYELELEENTGELIVNELQFRSYKIEREDKSYGGHLEFRGDNNLQRAFLSTLYSEFVDKEQRNHFEFGFENPQAGLTGENREVSVQRLLEYGQYDNSTSTSTLGADMQFSEWEVEGRLNFTDTEFNMDLPIPRSMGGATLASYDVSDIEDPLLYLDTNLADIDYARTIGIHFVEQLDIDAVKLKLDARRELQLADHGVLLGLGIQYDQRDADGHVRIPEISGFPKSIDIDAFNTGKGWESNTTNTVNGTYYNNKDLLQVWEAVGGLGAVEISPENVIVIEEEILATYAMATIDFDWGNLIFGARIERTDYRSEGNVEGSPISVTDDFTNVLPSAHLNFNLTDDVKLRLSASSGVNRPTYTEWRAAASVDVIEKEVKGGNPTLKAEEASGVDVSVEWYFSPASILSLGAFYRSIDNVIYADSTTIDGGIYLPGAEGEDWTYTGAVNGDDGKMHGVELNFIAHADSLLPSPWDGLGVSANMTFMGSEFKDIDGVTFDLPGTSDLIYNASLFYEKYGFSIRASYQYRDEWISPVEDPSEVWGEQKRVDLSLVYNLPNDFYGAGISFYANANNLTNETDVRYAGNGTLNQSESYGRRYVVGLRLNF